MNITDVRIRRMTKEGNMKAVASITLDNEFAIHDIKIIVRSFRKQYSKHMRRCFFHSIEGGRDPGCDAPGIFFLCIYFYKMNCDTE